MRSENQEYCKQKEFKYLFILFNKVRIKGNLVKSIISTKFEHLYTVMDTFVHECTHEHKLVRIHIIPQLNKEELHGHSCIFSGKFKGLSIL